MKRSYNSIAPFYDRLAGLVYGSARTDAWKYLLGRLKPYTNILLIGGGTGEILEDITAIYAQGLTITYVDASAAMISRSRKRNVGDNKVLFVTAAVEDFFPEEEYDTIITPFLFDNFSDQTSQMVSGRLYKYLKSGGLWLNCDFEDNGALWQKAILRIMYVFFMVCCGIEASSLPDMAACFPAISYEQVSERYFCKRFIAARVYEKR